MPAGDRPAEDAIEVWDEHWNSFAIFRACATQWRVAGAAFVFVHLGLDYAGVEAVMRQLLPAGCDRARVFADVLVMEAAALPILNEAMA